MCIDAKRFFSMYAPGIKNWRHKLRGRSSKNKPIDFTESDLLIIYKGIVEMKQVFFISMLEK